MKKRILQGFALLLALLPAWACHRDIPVETINLTPQKTTMFIGESIPVTISWSPEEATNTDEINVYSTNDKIITYQNGTVTAVGKGDAAISATCGNVLAQCRIKVYKDKFQKGKSTYGVDYATGYKFFCSEPTVQEVEIILVHTEPNGDLQQLDVWVQVGHLGKELDFTKPIEGWSYAGVYLNNNEDGYLVFASEDGEPSIHLADWSDPGDVTLTRGILRVDHLGFTDYRIHADFELSNGYRFSTDWEDTATLKDS